jgi:hypothetical protein
LSRHVHEAARDRAADAVSHLLNDATHALSRTSKGPFNTKRSLSTAQIFMDLILLPMVKSRARIYLSKSGQSTNVLFAEVD